MEKHLTSRQDLVFQQKVQHGTTQKEIFRLETFFGVDLSAIRICETRQKWYCGNMLLEQSKNWSNDLMKYKIHLYNKA